MFDANIPLPFRLCSLALDLHPDDPNLPTLIPALFHSGRVSLHTLHLGIYHQSIVPLLYAPIQSVGPQLRTLRLESRHDALQDHLDLFATLSRLQSLEFRPTNPFTNPSNSLLAILDALPSPPTLLNLSLSLMNPSHLKPFIPILKHPALARLTTLELSMLSGSMTQDKPIARAMAEVRKDRRIRVLVGGK